MTDEVLDPAVATALARLYDVDLVEDPGDLDLYRALAARADGPILELAVGTGRLAVPLAADGWPVTGVDLDPAMLARARTRASAAGRAVAARLTLVEEDLVGLRLPNAGTFQLAFIALNSLLLLPDRAAQRAALATLATHLAPGGLAVIDAIQPDARDLARYDGRLILSYVRTDPETGRVVSKMGSAEHDPAGRIIDLTSIFDEGAPGEPPQRWIRTDRLRIVGAEELIEFAEAAGLQVETLAGDLELGSFGPDSERAVLVANRPPD